MKIKLLIASLLFPITVFAADTYNVDPVHTFSTFRIKHLDIGYTYGQFTAASGSFTFDKDAPEKSSVNIIISADSISTHDAKRDKHLNSPDFFNTKLYKELSFKSTSVKKLSDTEFEVAGDLTIHGITKQITTKLTKVGEGLDPWGMTRMGFETSFDIKRSDFGLGFMLDKVGDEVNVGFSVEGTKK